MELELEKRLLEKEVTTWLEKGYKVDVKKGVVRGVEYHARVSQINVSDTDISENDFNDIIEHAKLELAFSKSSKPVITNFKN